MVINLQQDAHDTFQDALDLHLHNTQISYSAKQAEFKAWMLSKSFADNITVTGERTHLFLRGEVCGRKRKNDDSKVIGYATVRQYGTACIDLYKQQKSLNMNANPHPQDCPSLNVLFNSFKSDESNKCQGNFEDRGIGTMQDKYSSLEELSRIANYFLCGNSSSSFHF
jgi:hypothetical protein